MTDIRERIATIIAAHPLTYAGTYCECNPEHEYASCDSNEAFEKHAAHVADVIVEELVDLAGTGQLLASIDRLYR